MTPAEQLVAIRRELNPMLAQHMDCWHNDLLPQLRKQGIEILDHDDLKRKQRKLLRGILNGRFSLPSRRWLLTPAIPFLISRT